MTTAVTYQVPITLRALSPKEEKHGAKAVGTPGVNGRRASVPGIFLKANLFWNGEGQDDQHGGGGDAKFAVGVPVSADCAVCFMSQGGYHCNRSNKQKKEKRTDTKRGS